MPDQPSADAETTDTEDLLPPVVLPLLEVHPKGRLAGRTLHMRYPSVGFLIARKRGQANNETWWAELLDAIEDHNLGRDPAALPAALVNEIGVAWVDAIRDAAVPPA